jgi:hypothetical protein
VKVVLTILSSLSLAGCALVDPDNYRARADSSVWASKNDIIAAAAKCKEPNIKPWKAGNTWAIATKNGKPISRAKSQCIHSELDRQNLLVTS